MIQRIFVAKNRVKLFYRVPRVLSWNGRSMPYH